MKRRSGLLGLICVLAFTVNAATAHADFTFIGPHAYQSAADSPFDMSGLGSTFFLDDFEDFRFDDPPGVVASSIATGFGNSVDGDDGAIDGMSNGNASGHLEFLLSSPTGQERYAEFVFNSTDLGSFPKAFGMAFTAKANSSDMLSASLSVYDFTGAQLATFDLTALHSASGNATDDLFVGITSDEGLPIVVYHEARFFIPGVSPVPAETRIDHVQYGLAIPEPTTLALCLVTCAVMLLFSRSLREHSYGDLTNDSASSIAQWQDSAKRASSTV